MVMKFIILDKGERRLGIERRQLIYTVYIPERRSDKERRSNIDRRLKPRLSKYKKNRTISIVAP